MLNLDLIKLEEIDSTNQFGKLNIDTLQDKQVIVADRQLRGRGRFNRTWVCDNNSNVYLSIILKPSLQEIEGYPFANLTQYLSVVLANFLEDEYGVIPTIKWPNDILIDGAKISGILCEAQSSNNEIKGLVLGLGVNLNMTEETIKKIDQKATSLNLLIGQTVDKDLFINKLLDNFFERYDDFKQKGFELIKEEYINRCDFLNKKIKITNNQSVNEYFAEKINTDGSLRVSDEKNNLCDIITGDLTC